MSKRENTLTEIIHLRISKEYKDSIEEIAKALGLIPADIERLALGIFIWLWQKLSGADFLKRWLLSFVENKND